MFKSVRVYINKASAEPIKGIKKAFLAYTIKAGYLILSRPFPVDVTRQATQHQQETILPLSDLPEDLLVLESREGDEKDEDEMDDDASNHRQQAAEPEAKELESLGPAARFNHMQNFISHKLKKIYFDSRINSHDNDGFLSKVLKGDSVGIMVGSLGISSAANKHPVFESLISEIQGKNMAAALESVEIFMGYVCPASCHCLTSVVTQSLCYYGC